MSELDRDLRAPVSTPGQARASMNDLLRMWGTLEVLEDKVIRSGMYAVKETWVRVSGSGRSAVYERQGED